jgi:hypothetical protein
MKQADVPTLQSIYRVQWSNDTPEDSDYSEAEDTDDLAEASGSAESAGSSDEWEGGSEPDHNSEEGEDSDMDSEGGYVHKHECSPIHFSFNFIGKKPHLRRTKSTCWRNMLTNFELPTHIAARPSSKIAWA